MSIIKEVTTEQDWKEVFELSSINPVFIFKHSTTCPISAEAHAEYLGFVEEHEKGELTFSLVRVIEERPISNLISKELDVKHESPQLILIKDKNVQWSASHWNITKKNITKFLG
ncbi:bacillithiol system redox-active protein YtxJ [Bacillus solitudinis]|uniref:bacillithiol system redox-active protein YtxJ n=1 Tax=Bacillus solitudinis TaxID=2014074 RepID=UPI000C232CCC|nr:bacillithiol system redox-active protein YtxJ [Bacillus solitudinis]